MGVLSCIGKDGIERRFTVTHTEDKLSEDWTFRARTIPPPKDGASFDLVLKELDDQTARVIMINHYGNTDYVAKGIPDELLSYAAQVMKRRIQSSPTYQSGDVSRTPAATMVWKRLEGSGKATYDKNSDIYQLN